MTTGSHRLLSTTKLADYLDVSPATVRRLVKSRNLPKPLRLPGIRRDLWDSAAIDRYIDRLAGKQSEYDDPDEICFGGKQDAA